MDSETMKTRELQMLAAGHANKLRIRQSDDGRLVLKPIKDEKEKNFYDTVFDENQSECVKKLQDFIPRYHGETVDQGLSCVVLENLVHEYQNPSIVDIKIGRITYEPTSAPDKISREKEKYKGTRIPLGFCIPGMKIFDRVNGNYINFDKDYGKKLNVETVREVLKKFITVNETLDDADSLQLWSRISEKLSDMQRWFTTQKKFHFYSSSIFIVYEIEDNDQKVDVRIIDFAHVNPANDTTDDNFLFGLNNLIKTLTEIAQDK